MSTTTAPQQSEYRMTDPAAFARNMATAMERAAEIATIFARQADAKVKDPTRQGERLGHLAQAFGNVAQQYMTRPDKLIEANFNLWQQHAHLWQNAWRRFLGGQVEPVVHPDRADKRFKDKQWEENQVFDFLKQSYLITSKWAQDLIANAEGLDPQTRAKAGFYVEQIANALSPTNFAFTNPEVLRVTMASNGENLAEGLTNLLEDLTAGKGELRIKQTDMAAFEVGRNIAVTPGKVVFQNDMMQLIQYAPSTKEVYKRPLLIVPPWINKFYILDLNEKKSFIRWAVAQGLTVFVVSWVNPDERLAMKHFAHYMKEGILAAIDAIEQATGERDVNAIGYCIGGTLLMSTLGYMAATGDKRVRSATLFTTQVDFELGGDIRVFIDEGQVQSLERDMAEKGYLHGRKMATAFNMLRSNDLIWSYAINNYLLGRDPVPFDLLYWNSDSTRLPAAMHSFYLRECYLYNNLANGLMVLDGVTINLKKVKIPIYNLAAREDHIAPMASAFRVGKNVSGKTRFVVSGSGHIAGVINPPDMQKYQYWLNDKGAETPEQWLAGATEHPGSWWPDWAAWIGKQSGPKVAARKPGDGKLKPIEDAPGSYVKVKVD